MLDADGMSDIDYSAARALGQFAADLRHRGVQLGVARTSHLVHHDLKHSGLLDDVGADRLFPSSKTPSPFSLSNPERRAGERAEMQTPG